MKRVLSDFRERGGYQRWQRWADWPLIGLALVFLVVLVLPLAEPLNRESARTLGLANGIIWAVFALDYVTRLYLALDRRMYVRTHLLELLVVAVPFLRPLRLLRLLVIVAATTRRAGGRLVQRVTVLAVCLAAVIMATSAVVVFDAEKTAPHRTIITLGDSIWWSVSTVTTVGYGDLYPVTPLGRAMATLLMLTGITLVGTVTAAVAAWFVNVIRNAANTGHGPILAAEHDVAAQVSALAASVDRLGGELAALRADLNAKSQ